VSALFALGGKLRRPGNIPKWIYRNLQKWRLCPNNLQTSFMNSGPASIALGIDPSIRIAVKSVCKQMIAPDLCLRPNAGRRAIQPISTFSLEKSNEERRHEEARILPCLPGRSRRAVKEPFVFELGLPRQHAGWDDYKKDWQAVKCYRCVLPIAKGCEGHSSGNHE
jgi:hypothetical protein